MRTLKGVSTNEQNQQLPGSGDDAALSEPIAAVEPTATAEPAAAVEPALPDVPKHSLLLYTAARLGLLLIAAAVLYLLGARSWFLLILAFLVSGLLSFVLLKRLRDGVSVKVASRVDASRERRAAAAHAEDDLY